MSSELSYSTVEKIYQEIKPRNRVIEIGCRDINGSVRPIFKDSFYRGIDVRPGDNVDIVADTTTFVPYSKVDLVVCLSVFEHTDKADDIILNASQWLTDDGIMLIEAAHTMKPHSPVDGSYYPGEIVPYGDFYQNVTEDDLMQWLWMFPAKKIWTQYRAIWAIAWKSDFPLPSATLLPDVPVIVTPVPGEAK